MQEALAWLEGRSLALQNDYLHLHFRTLLSSHSLH